MENARQSESYYQSVRRAIKHVHDRSKPGSIPLMAPDVVRVFEGCPDRACIKLLEVRELIFETAAAIDGVGQLTETLKWGEPAYLTEATKAGSTIRIGSKQSSSDQYAVYFNCRTNLVETFRFIYPGKLEFSGNRAILLAVLDELPVEPLTNCIAMALTYHLAKRGR